MNMKYEFEVCKFDFLWQNLGDVVVSDEAAEISPRHAKMPDDVREL